MTLDVRPVWLIAALCSSGFGVFVLLLRRNYSEFLGRALSLWALAYLCFGSMFFLCLEKDSLPVFLVYVVGLTLGAIGFVFEYWAISVLKKQKAVKAWLISPPLALVAFLVWSYFSQFSIPLSLAASDLVFAAMMIRCAVSFADSEEHRRRLVDGAAAFCLATLALSSLLETIGYAHSSHLSSDSGFSSPRIIYSTVVAVVVEGVLFGLFLLAVAERLNDNLNFQALHDHLTGVYNRQAFEDIGLHEVVAAARTGAPLSLFLVDIDQFKRFNEQYGHSIGDFILKAAARTLEGCLREEDYICRWGGDEFCALLRRSTREDAEKVAERTLAAFQAMDLAVQGKQIQVGISIGIVTVVNGPANFPSLVNQADAALAKAKESGRNRFVMI